MERATYTVDELAALLGIGRDRVYRGLREKRIPHVQGMGKHYVIPKAAVDRWLAEAGQAQVVPWPQGGYQA